MILLKNESYTLTELPEYVTVGKYTSIGEKVRFHSLSEEHQWSINHNCVYTTNFDQPSETGEIIIGNDVWVCEGVRILPGTIIGDGAIIGAGAVIANNVQPYAIVVGNPQVNTGYRFTPDQIHELFKIHWFDWSKEKVEENKELMKDINKFLEKWSQ